MTSGSVAGNTSLQNKNYYDSNLIAVKCLIQLVNTFMELVFASKKKKACRYVAPNLFVQNRKNCSSVY